MTNVSELVAPELDYWVARCEGMGPEGGGGFTIRDGFVMTGPVEVPFTPSTGWRFGGPVIERLRIELTYMPDHTLWLANMAGKTRAEHGDTPLVAAMRAYVASTFGDTVEAP